MTEVTTTHTYDAVVVGSGFAGAWAAKELTEAGFHTLVLEAGPPRTAGEIPKRYQSVPGSQPQSETQQEWENHQIQSRHPAFFRHGSHLFVNDTQHPYQTPDGKPYSWIRGMQVGGRSLIWGGTALRMSRREFDAPELDNCDLSWPVKYEDLAESYTAVEQLMGLRGSAEGLGQIPDSVYQYGPHDLTPAEKEFQAAYTRFGTRPIPVRFVPPDTESNGWPGFTMQATALAAAEQTGKLRLRPNAFAAEVTVDQKTGQATGVRYVDTSTGEWHQARARVVFVCCGTIETARLMLNSRSERHPRGLGNSSGWLGCGLMDHPAIWAKGVLDYSPPVTGYDPPSRQRGLFIPPGADAGADVRPFGLWVSFQRATVDGQAFGAIDAQGEMLPYKHNRVTLSDERDRWGVPTPLIECGYGPHERRLYSAMRHEIERAAAIAGLRITTIPETLSQPGENVHEMGSARMGSDPGTSVLDPQNRCWDCQNVFVTDGSCFPSAGWQNPTLTIMALSARAGRYAAGLLRDGAC